MDVKAEFEKLAETDFQESDSDGYDIDGDSSGAEGNPNGGGRGGKWKQRVKELQKYVKWQIAEAETKVRAIETSSASL